MMSSAELYVALVNLWHAKRTWNISQVLEWRQKELKRMDGDIFFKFHKWPKYMRRIYFQNAFPHGDSQTFQLVMFLVGNEWAVFLSRVKMDFVFAYNGVLATKR